MSLKTSILDEILTVKFLLILTFFLLLVSGELELDSDFLASSCSFLSKSSCLDCILFWVSTPSYIDWRGRYTAWFLYGSIVKLCAMSTALNVLLRPDGILTRGVRLIVSEGSEERSSIQSVEVLLFRLLWIFGRLTLDHVQGT